MIVSGAQLQKSNIVTLGQLQCSARARIIAITIAHHTNSECGKAQDLMIFNISTSQQFYIALHNGNNNKALCTSAQHLHIELHDGGNDKALCASAQHLHIVSHEGKDNKASCASA